MCASDPWTFARAKNDAFIEVCCGKPEALDGTARFGYVTGLKSWVYRDFHTDGSYADLSARFITPDRWEFTGPYYPAGADAPLDGVIGYRIVSPTQYARTFASRRPDGSIEPSGGDTCRKMP